MCRPCPSAFSQQLRHRQLVGCLQKSTYVPWILTEYGRLATPLSSPEGVYDDRIATLTAMVANLRAAIRSKAITDNGNILSAAYMLEAELGVWAATLPTSRAYRTVRLPQNNCAVRTVWGQLHPYDGCYHIYPDLTTINSWCYYRVSRIFVNEIILDCLRRVLFEKETLGDLRNQCRNIRGTINKLAADICASAPYLFGVLGDRQSEKEGGTCLGGYMLLLPLFTAGSVEGPTHPLRQYTIECFQLIAHNMGISHALADIDILRVQTGIVEWIDELDEEFKVMEIND
jgi:hypothetical protein